MTRKDADVQVMAANVEVIGAAVVVVMGLVFGGWEFFAAAASFRLHPHARRFFSVWLISPLGVSRGHSPRVSPVCSNLHRGISGVSTPSADSTKISRIPWKSSGFRVRIFPDRFGFPREHDPDGLGPADRGSARPGEARGHEVDVRYRLLPEPERPGRGSPELVPRVRLRLRHGRVSCRYGVSAMRNPVLKRLV